MKIIVYGAGVMANYVKEAIINSGNEFEGFVDPLGKGNFETGSKGIMELEGMPPMEYELTHVKVFEEFWDKTATPFGDILFGHQIIDNNDGSVIIKHSVSLDSEDIQHLEFLKQVFSDVPDSIFILKKYLES